MSRSILPISRMSFLLPVAFLIGCGGTATVTGKVSYHGRPVTHGWVSIMSSDRTAKSGVIQPDGSYAVKNVHPGRVKIAVGSRNPSKSHVAKSQEKANKIAGKENSPATAGEWFPIPRQYEDPEKSGLQCTIESGQVSHDIDLRPIPK